MGLGHLGERLAASDLLAELIDGDAERLGRRVEPAAHTAVAAGPAALLDAQLGAGLVHRLLEPVGRDPQLGGEGGDELLLALLFVGLLLAGRALARGAGCRRHRARRRRLLRSGNAEAGADQRQRGDPGHRAPLQ